MDYNIIVLLSIIVFIILILSYYFHYKQIENFDNQIKINGIDQIVWINLDRSKERRTHMNNLLRNVNVPNKRISAIDGIKIDTKKIIKDLDCFSTMKNTQIACTLSHIKAIQSLKNESGNYFMVCEDDILFDNLKFFNKDLKTIISEAPKDFEILMIYKTWPRDTKNNYIKWKNNYKEFKLDSSSKMKRNGWIAGTCCYIITKKGIDKLSNYVKYINDNKFIFNKSFYNKFDLADVYIYLLLNTYVYRYNFINIRLDDTTMVTSSKNYLNNHSRCSMIQKNIILQNLDKI